MLSEGERIETKHLITLEGAISTRQTDDMRQKKLQLIVPGPLHATYKDPQRDWLWSVSQFFEHVESREREYGFPA